jgi:hypothetical protein
MNTPQKPGKRIVSKGKYAANIGKIVAWSSAAVVTCIYGWLFAADVEYDVCCYGKVTDGLSYAKFTEAMVMSGGCSIAFLYFSTLAVRKARKVKVGVPLTRANTADLPAPESLVRAAGEPVQEQQTVLLRAATEGTETHEEQLLRASAGAQDSHKEGT